MSDEPVTTGAEEVAPASPEVGTGEAEATPERSFLPDDYSDHYVRVKVDGQDLEVPLSEALQGYSRTQDYTRKTQQLADGQRELQYAMTLQRALENNPQATLRLLQEQYAQAEAETDDDDFDWEDPGEVRQREYDQRVAYLEQQQANRELNEAIGVLRQRYGEDFDPGAVVSRAAAQGRMDLEGVYKEIAFERYWATQQAQNDATRQREAEDAARTAAKSQVPAHIGGSVNGAVATEEPSQPMSVAEAFAQAKRQLGL